MISMVKRLNYFVMKIKIFVLIRKMTHARYNNCFQFLENKSQVMETLGPLEEKNRIVDQYKENISNGLNCSHLL